MNTNEHVTQLIELLRTAWSAIATPARPSQAHLDCVLSPPYLHH